MLKLVPTPIRQYANFIGRITRSQFFRWLGFLLAVYVVVAWLDLRFIAPMLGYLPFEDVEEQYLTTGAAILLFIPWLASCVRRLHDANKTGWWMLFAVLPALIMYFSNEVGFYLYNSLTSGGLSTIVSKDLATSLLNNLSFLIPILAAISFAPVIYLHMKKGSSEPNRYGERT